MATSPNVDKRSQKREILAIEVTYSYSAEEQGMTKNFTGRGLSLDMSESGICIYSPVPLEENALLSVCGREAWDGARKGAVRWCQMIIEDLFKVGIKLLN